MDLIASGALSRGESGIYRPIWNSLLTHGDYSMHLADLSAYVSIQEELGQLFRRPEAWAHRAILNVAHSGKFSSDRTILEDATGIWGVEP